MTLKKCDTKKPSLGSFSMFRTYHLTVSVCGSCVFIVSGSGWWLCLGNQLVLTLSRLLPVRWTGHSTTQCLLLLTPSFCTADGWLERCCCTARNNQLVTNTGHSTLFEKSRRLKAHRLWKFSLRFIPF